MGNNRGGKHLLTLLIGLCLLSGAAVTANASDAEPEMISESAVYQAAEAEITWTITDGTLYISGTGAMPRYYSGAPWKNESFTKAVISKGITSIDFGAFDGCTALESITLPGGFSEFETSAVQNCENLEEILVDEANTTYTSQNGILFSKDMTKLVYYPQAKAGTTYTFPSSVQTIGAFAFHKCRNIVELTIPDTVSVIEDGAFFVCENLSGVVLPEGITEIGSDVFNMCSALTDITIPDTVTSIGDGAFASCGFTSIEIPDSVETIGDSAFSCCNYLSEVVLSEGVTEIGGYAFSWCGNLTEISLPDTLVTIGNNAFTGTNLTSIVIPEGVISIGSNMFDYVYGLQEARILNPDMIFGTDVFKNAQDVLTIYGYAGSTAEIYADKNGHDFELLDGETGGGDTVADIAWEITDGTLYISGTGAMPDYGWGDAPWYSESFTKAVIGEGITTIGACAFCNCTELEQVIIPDGVTLIGESAFDGCRKLTSVTIPDSVTEICAFAFCGCSFTEIDIPEGVEYIGCCAFDYCENLVSVTIPASAVDIDMEWVFDGCTSLTEINVAEDHPFFFSEDGVWYWEQEEMTVLVRYPDGKTDTEYTLSASVTGVNSWAFHQCKNLKAIHVADGNPCYSSVDGVLFEQYEEEWDDEVYREFTLIRYPAGKTDTDYEIPDSVTNISDDAFNDCKNLVSVSIPATVSFINKWMFTGCGNLEAIHVADGNPCYSSVDGVLFEQYEEERNGEVYREFALIRYPEGKTDTDYEIPEGVTGIYYGAFLNCEYLTSVTIPEGVKYIGYGAFENCENLVSVTIPASAVEIDNDEDIFYGCTSLTEINVAEDHPFFFSENGVWYEKWEDEMFLIRYPAGKTDTEYTLSASVTGVNSWAFHQCKNLKAIHVADGNPCYSSVDGVLFKQYEEEWDDEVYREFTLIRYPEGKTDTDYEIPEGVTDIYYEAFLNCEYLTSVTIPESVEWIDDWVFEGCYSLEDITVLNPEMEFSDWAFRGCSSDLTIHGYADSTAQTYAEEKGYAFVVLGSEEESEFAWEITDGTLYISGTGAMPEYDSWENPTPWAEEDFEKIVIGEGITSIGAEAFDGCEGLTQAILPSTLTEIGEYAFGDCVNLVSITLPAGLAEIGGGAFSGCIHLADIVLPDSLTTIGDGAFYMCAIETMDIPEGVVYIGNCAFKSCEKLVSATIPASAVRVDMNWDIFDGCTLLVEINIAEDHPFYFSEDGIWYWEEDGEVELVRCPAGKTDTDYTLPASVTGVSPWAFNGCRTLRAIHVEEGNPYYISINGVLFVQYEEEWDGEVYSEFVLIRYPEGKTDSEYEVPDGVLGLAECAFANCANLVSVTIPESVEWTEDWVFGDCVSLDNAVILNPDMDFGGNAVFAYCHPDFTLHGYAGSTAETYAEENDHSFEVLSAVSGDIDSDGVLDESDADLLAKYFAGYNVSIDPEAADINGDGEVTRKDAMFLARYLAGWTGYEVAEK